MNNLNSEGYSSLNNKMYKQAILLFKLNVEIYPTSSNVYDSLGKVLMLIGEKDSVIENYQKSLLFNPNSTNSKKYLNR